ncbi:nucleotidyl transferase AbiEii/AbiGii toxin family protein [Chamaesiphon polymorphus]|uniref:Nucleotidyl transferase AbiEii/AbiGii toxin family protein n=1 Tax=Chamaesiphon polymorphus CCALA 037 TaxID=2107692 RepID=A0A2T1G2N9_9CYAN|nr:nucleotidyl transferase AbiEii/AbiGii toxin family protein [Chamaesiphon polymorphus]PSB51514.1 nucleotidyl transferase AbiEii/AbiGii toxin family protein [Chamaesiphon polymorphus CCALA 037]
MNQPRNLAASVRQRLLNLAIAQKEDFNLVLTRYGIERLLYRLERSAQRERFILKGAMLFILWSDTPHRTTKYVDLLCRGDNSITEIEAIFRAVCQVEVVPDGLEFDRATVKGELIKADREYPGVRIRLTAFIAGTLTRINLQIDVGFGDIVTPAAQLMSVPALLADLPAPQLYAYNRETVIAEKFEAMVLLGIGNTRMKDFYDLWYLSQHFTFEGNLLGRAIAATFERRHTPIPIDTPLALTSEFADDETKQRQWVAFVRKGKLTGEGLVLNQIGLILHDFLMPPTIAIGAGVEFDRLRSSGLGWHSK